MTEETGKIKQKRPTENGAKPYKTKRFFLFRRHSKKELPTREEFYRTIFEYFGKEWQ